MIPACGANVDVGDSAAEALTSSTEASLVMLKASGANTGFIYVQLSGSAAAAATAFELDANDTTPWLPVPGQDLANISVIASVDGEDISFIYLR